MWIVGFYVLMVTGAGMIVGATQADSSVAWLFAVAGLGMIGVPMIIIFCQRKD